MTTQKKTTIGGQAIIEGIVMKGPKKDLHGRAQGEWRAGQQDRTAPIISPRSGACPSCAARTRCSPP